MAIKKYNLPKAYLSYSAIELWRKDKPRFRRKYYEGIEEPGTVYSLFGSEVHEQIEKDPKYSSIRLPKAEHRMEVDVCGVKVLGYIDTFDPDTFAFGEYKSGIRKPDGSPRWTQADVNQHDQLPFYSLLIQEKYGVKINHTYLVWLETAMREEKVRMNGVILGGERELYLTGEWERFERRMYQYDRERMKKWIVESAKEISEDYECYLKSK